MKTIIGIDPGPVESAYVVWDGKVISDFDKINNCKLLTDIEDGRKALLSISMAAEDLVIERITSQGMPVGASTFETVLWSGFFCHAWGDWIIGSERDDKNRIPRGWIKMHLCNSMRAKDSNIRQALIDRFEPDLLPRQRPKGVLKGISKDCWQALAVAVTWYDLNVT